MCRAQFTCLQPEHAVDQLSRMQWQAHTSEILDSLRMSNIGNTANLVQVKMTLSCLYQLPAQRLNSLHPFPSAFIMPLPLPPPVLLRSSSSAMPFPNASCTAYAVVRLLVAAGASPCTPDAMGDTPLHLAVRAGNTHVVQALCCVKAVAAGSAQGPVPAVTGAGTGYSLCKLFRV